MRIGQPSYVTGLVGAGIGGSLSPALHEREAELNGLRYVYRIIDLDALGLNIHDTPAVLTAARQMGFTGLNITHPGKQIVVDHLDELSADAAAIGAVNTVVFDHGRAVGHNTDWLGFARNVESGLPGIEMNRVVLLGAGGAGAAVAYAALTLGADVLTVFDTDGSRADELVRRLRARFGTKQVLSGALDQLGSALAGADGLIHATPTGMATFPGLPLPAGFLHPGLWVADLVYRPLDTELLQRARAIGCRSLDGGGMLVYQAVEAFRLFTGVQPNTDRMLHHFATLVGEVIFKRG